MKTLAIIAPLFLLAAFCAGTGGGGNVQSIAQPGHGAITVEIIPNPIVAKQVSGNTYDFPFDVVVRETGGHPVTVNRVTADVYAIGGIRIAQETYDAAKIASLGYPMTIAANQELLYRFNPRKDVPDERLFSSVSADITVDAVDDSGTPTQAKTTVTVRR